MESIPNSLVDVMLLVGIDDNTGLLPVIPHDDELLTQMFGLTFEPQVLSVIDATDMVNFFPFPHRDSNYPPAYDQDSTEMHSIEMEQQRERMMSAVPMGNKKFMQSYSPKKTMRSVSVNPKMLTRTVSVRRQTNAKVVMPLPELPISDEVLRSLPSFCFPDGMKVYRNKPDNSTHFLVLTDMLGNKSYTSCLTFYRTYLVENDDQGNVYMTFDNSGKDVTATDDKVQCYIPHCCITISKFPYFTKMKECLSSMVKCVEKDPEEMVVFLKEFANMFTHTPVPPAGNVSVELNLNQIPVTLLPSSHPDKPVIDFPLHLIFLCFPTEEFLKILACVLVEERLVFMSQNYALLTFVMEGVRNLVLPFKWRFTYVTVLPSNGLEYLQAPGTFMFGCHSQHKQEVEQVGGLVLVDIDRGTVQINPDPLVNKRERKGFPSLPKETIRIFTEKSVQFKLHFDLLDIQRPYSYDMKDDRLYRIKKVDEQNTTIIYACLELMVNLFRGVVYKLRVEHNHFNREQFLNQQEEADRDFYERVFKTDMFKVFLNERMLEQTDYWSDLEMKTRGLGQSKSMAGGSGGKRKLQKQQTVTKNTPVDRREITAFILPDVTDTRGYVKNSIKKLTKAIKECPDFDDRASYLYLRSLFCLANNDKMAAIDDFNSLSVVNSRILPTKVLDNLYKNLTEQEMSELKKKQGHAVLLDIMEDMNAGDRHTEHGMKKIRMDPVSIPERDLKYEEFVEYVSLLEMTNDYDTMRHLFEALTASKRQTYVEQITFQMCVDHWVDNHNQCNLVCVEDGCLEEEESILKMSTLKNTDYGLGRIGLTDKRLFFLYDVSNKYQEIAKLRDISSLEKSANSSFFSYTDTLQVHSNSKARVFTVALKEERNWWYMVINEMWAGKKVAEATRDIMAIHQALQNTLLIDAVIASGQEECTSHHADVEGAAALLAHYSDFMKKGKHNLPKETVKALQHKIDPNMGERERKTVQALLYTGGDGTLSPRLWCGLSDGKVKVYNAISWVLESEFVQTKQCVACLTAIGESHVWVGSFGIFIIGTETITCNHSLMDHQDLVVDIVLYDNDRYAFTASLDGTIIKWDIQKLSHAQPPIHLKQIKSLRSLKICQDKLLCGTWACLILCGLDGTELKRFEARENNRIVEIDSFCVLPGGEIWAGCRREGLIYIWDCDSGNLMKIVSTTADKGISIMAVVDEKIWVGTKDGKIRIFDMKRREQWQELQAHEDAVRVLYDIKNRYMLSGGGSMDGKVCIWSVTTKQITDSDKFLELSSTHM